MHYNCSVVDQACVCRTMCHLVASDCHKVSACAWSLLSCLQPCLSSSFMQYVSFSKDIVYIFLDSGGLKAGDYTQQHCAPGLYAKPTLLNGRCTNTGTGLHCLCSVYHICNNVYQGCSCPQLATGCFQVTVKPLCSTHDPYPATQQCVWGLLCTVHCIKPRHAVWLKRIALWVPAQTAQTIYTLYGIVYLVWAIWLQAAPK